MELDDDNQPIIKTFNAARLSDRKIDELIGLCKGVLSDGAVSEGEAIFLQQWLSTNKEISNLWPANIIYNRINEMLTDNILDPDEEKELLELLLEVTGGPTLNETISSMSSTLPISTPDPLISYEKTVFCLTGKFITGSRKQCENIIKSRGGNTCSSPTKKTNYVVIGLIGSSDWIHSTHGRKIEKAVDLRDKGHDIHIITEELWANN